MNKEECVKLNPDNFEQEMTTIWSFKERGDWATHNPHYRGNWSPYIPRNLILRYSKEKDLVLDQFVGGGTTLVEAKLLNRNIIGVDINPGALRICKKAIDFKCPKSGNVILAKGNAQKLDMLKDNSIDFICTHPPYANIIKYSDEIKNDISLLNTKDFIKAMGQVASESYRVLKDDKFCAILMGDTRKNGRVVPLGFSVMNEFLKAGFKLKEIIIKEQHNCKATGFWKSSSIKYNFLLLAHEYLFVFIKDKQKKSVKKNKNYRYTVIDNQTGGIVDIDESVLKSIMI